MDYHLVLASSLFVPLVLLGVAPFSHGRLWAGIWLMVSAAGVFVLASMVQMWYTDWIAFLTLYVSGTCVGFVRLVRCRPWFLFGVLLIPAYAEGWIWARAYGGSLAVATVAGLVPVLWIIAWRHKFQH